MLPSTTSSISDCDGASPGYEAGCTACSATACTQCGDGYVLKADGSGCIGEQFLLLNYHSFNRQKEQCKCIYGNKDVK